MSQACAVRPILFLVLLGALQLLATRQNLCALVDPTPDHASNNKLMAADGSHSNGFRMPKTLTFPLGPLDDEITSWKPEMIPSLLQQKSNETITVDDGNIPVLWGPHRLTMGEVLGEGGMGQVVAMEAVCAEGGAKTEDTEAISVVLKAQGLRRKKRQTKEGWKGRIEDAIDETIALLDMSQSTTSTPFVVGLVGGIVGVKFDVIDNVVFKQGELYYLMPAMHGGEFIDLMRAEDRYLSFVGGRACAVALLQNVLKGLHRMHQRGWVHMDMKLQNAMYSCATTTEGGQTCFGAVVDLGLVTKEGNPSGKGLRGTPGYIAPEVYEAEVQGSEVDEGEAKPKVPVTEKNDVFAVGEMLYAIFFRRFPDYLIGAAKNAFGNDNAHALKNLNTRLTATTDTVIGTYCMSADSSEPDVTTIRAAISDEHSDIAADVTNVICNMMKRNPAQRWTLEQSITEMTELASRIYLQDSVWDDKARDPTQMLTVDPVTTSAYKTPPKCLEDELNEATGLDDEDDNTDQAISEAISELEKVKADSSHQLPPYMRWSFRGA